MIKEILREIRNYFKDSKHDKALSVLKDEYSNVLSVHGKNGKLEFFEIHSHKEGSIWHYIKQGVCSYLAKKRRDDARSK